MRRLRIRGIDLATVGGPGIRDGVLRIEVGPGSSDRDRLAFRHFGRLRRTGRRQRRSIVVAQVDHYTRGETDAVPLAGIAKNVRFVVGVDVIHLRQTNGEPVGDVQIETAATAHGGVPLRLRNRRIDLRGADKDPHKRGERVGMKLILQSSQDVAYLGITAGTEMAAAIDQDAQIVHGGKIVNVGEVKALGYIPDFETKVYLAIGM